MSQTFRDSEKLLKRLGISNPNEIDIEAIAQYCGATVMYEPLDGAEARIIGYADRAIITVNSQSQRARQRFSIGHELGHWMWDRGKTAFSCDSNKVTGRWSGVDPETAANKYAAGLLLPKYLLKPLAAKKPITFTTVRDLAQAFETSLTATAIRLVQLGTYPAMVICSGPEGRKWFIAGPDVDKKLWPRKDLSHDTSAYAILNNSITNSEPTDIDADAWIDHRNAGDYAVREHSVRATPDQVLTLLWWKNESQIADLS